MPYPADLVGKYLDFTIEGDLKGLTSAAGKMFDESGLLPHQIAVKTVDVYRDESAGSGVLTLVPESQAWKFIYLKYIVGVVTIAPLSWGPILTGPMTGCPLCSYRHYGQQMFAHIGTGSPQSPETAEVKKDWREFVNTLPPLSVTGFDPFSRFSTAEIGAQQLGGVPDVLGYFDGQSAYAMVLAPLSERQNPLNKKIVKVGRVERVELLPWSRLDRPSGGWHRLRSKMTSKFRRLRSRRS